jgi:hypothetical protein
LTLLEFWKGLFVLKDMGPRVLGLPKSYKREYEHEQDVSRLERRRADKFKKEAEDSEKQAEEFRGLLKETAQVVIEATDELAKTRPEFYDEVMSVLDSGKDRDLMVALKMVRAEFSKDATSLRSKVDALTSESLRNDGRDKGLNRSYAQTTKAKGDSSGSPTRGLRKDATNIGGDDVNFCRPDPAQEGQAYELAAPRRESVSGNPHGVSSDLPEEGMAATQAEILETVVQDLKRELLEFEAIAGTRENLENHLRGLERNIGQLKERISALEREKNQAEHNSRNAQDFEKRKYESEMQILRSDWEKKLEDVSNDHQIAMNNLRRTHNGQMNYLEAQKTAFQNMNSDLQSGHEAEKKQMRIDHKSEIIRLTEEHNSKMRDLQLRHQSTTRELAQGHGNKIAQMIRSHEDAQVQLTSRLSMIEQEHLAEKDRMSREFSQKEAQYESRISQMIDEHKSAQEELMKGFKAKEQLHQGRVSHMQKEHIAEMGRLREEFEAKELQRDARQSKIDKKHASELKEQSAYVEAREQQHRARVLKMEKDHAAEMERLSQEVEEMEVKRLRETEHKEARLIADYKKKAADLEAFHAADKERLRKDVEAYSTALLERDDFKGLPDDDIKRKFGDIGRDVDILARLEWKADQKKWPKKILEGLSSNQRKLRKQILQDSIWVLLLEYIFCSPFRIFGEEGLSLEEQWNEQSDTSKTINGNNDLLTFSPITHNLMPG